MNWKEINNAWPLSVLHRLPRRTIIVLVLILVLLVSIRLALPSILLWYVNRTLDRIPDYEAQIDDIDVALWRGAYKIQGLHMRKEKSGSKLPFLAVKEIQLSVEWRALLQAKMVGEVELFQPQINIVRSKGQLTSTPDQWDEWREQAEKLFPFEINHLVMREGSMNYLEPGATPPIKLHLTKVRGEMRDITNRPRPGKPMPTTYNIDAVLFDSGQLKLEGSAQTYSLPNDFQTKIVVEKVDLKELNDVARHYAGFDFKSGRFSLYGELKAVKGQMKGYLKPLFEEVGVLDTQDFKNPVEAVWESIVSGAVKVLTHQPKDRLATVVPISGTVEKVDVALLTTLFNVFKNAFVKVLEPGLETKKQKE